MQERTAGSGIYEPAPDSELSLNVPVEFADVLDGLYAKDKISTDRDFVLLIFGGYLDMDEAEVALSFSYAASLEKRAMERGSHIDHEKAEAALKRASKIETRFADRSRVAEIQQGVIEYFSVPQNVLRIGLLSLQGPHPIY